MKIAILIVTVIVVVGILLFWGKKRFVAAEVNVTTLDIDAIFVKLNTNPKDGNFAAFAFTPLGEAEESGEVNIQFSIEGGRVGFDWVLLAPGNLRDEGRFRGFAEAKGYKVIAREGNDVKYLRIEGPNGLPGLCRAVIGEMYRIPPNAPIDLIPEGFEWP